MFLLIIAAIAFYLYKTGELQKWSQKSQTKDTANINEAKRILDIRYASGEISAEEYNKIKNLL